MTHKPVGYRPITEPSYTQLAAQEFSLLTPAPHTEVLFGPCPRCRGEFRDPLPAKLVKGRRGIGKLFRTVAQSRDDVVAMICLCPLDHPHRPDGERGCGAYWKLLIVEAP